MLITAASLDELRSEMHKVRFKLHYEGARTWEDTELMRAARLAWRNQEGAGKEPLEEDQHDPPIGSRECNVECIGVLVEPMRSQRTKRSLPPVLALTKGDLMDTNEESVPERPTSGASASSVKRSEHPPLSPSPLNNIGNLPPRIAPPRQPALRVPTSYPSSSRPICTMGPPLVNIAPANSSRPKEKPTNRRHSSIPLPIIVPPSHASSNLASTSKLVDRKPVVKDLQPPHRARPIESEPPKQEPAPYNHLILTMESEAIEVLNKK
ncbi:hypothetical protein DFH07DRAFT_976901 [Mycena maculata]|uniref:Uncharacterized protein n=1 Tax=Mycena maculata TaxID=230809 RepID=A0AAD7NWC5_9AGAR|nr:hypothetical protein DFH07DRAFT_976901 [Mycena maculata]